ncbi:MAG TPA: hypothetical protein VNT03_02020 [Baekduia sp.]|nr:hypothetical protein [Baekduia sp.]
MPARLARRIFATAACAIAALAPAAAGHAAGPPKTETASGGAVTATFTYTDAGEGTWTGLKIQVTRAGVVAFDAAPTADFCEEPYCAPGDPFTAKGSLRVVDVDGDGEPEVLVDLYTGGAHCCLLAEILRWTGTGYATFVRDFADFGYTIDAPAAAGRPATFVTGDQRFAYAFAPFAYSPFPVRLLTFTGATWRDVSRAHPETLRADAARQRKEYMKRRNGRLALGILAAWVADEYRLGRQRTADRFLAAELRAGRLKGDPVWPRRKAYISTLKRRLKAWGYAG